MGELVEIVGGVAFTGWRDWRGRGKGEGGHADYDGISRSPHPVLLNALVDSAGALFCVFLFYILKLAAASK